MKTPSISILIMLVLITGCNSGDESGAELISGTELKINNGFTASVATTEEGGQVLIVEPDRPGTIQKKEQDYAWKCTCGKEGVEGECAIKTKKGSDTAQCRGDCFCGFLKVPLPDKTKILSTTPFKKSGQ